MGWGIIQRRESLPSAQQRGRWHERVPGEPTYTCQLRAFAGAVRDGTPILTPPADSIANMSVIDAIYQAAGLPLRP